MTGRFRLLVWAAAVFLWCSAALGQPGPSAATGATPATGPRLGATAPATTPRPPAPPPATETASAPATETASAPTTTIAVVRWNTDYQSASQEAQKRNVPMVVIYFDPDSPTCQSFQEQTLADLSVRQYLANFASARINATTGDGQERLAATGQAETPVTQVFSPAGELLDTVPGAIVPPNVFQQTIERSVRYWQAAGATPATPAARWRAITARLLLATRAKAIADIDDLLKLPPADLSGGVTPARLDLAKGTALYSSSPEQAEECFLQALKLGPNDPQAGGKALLRLGDLATARKKYDQARNFYAEYIRTFAQGPDIGEAYCAKAMLELLPLDDRAAAEKTLTEFIAKCPDDFLVVRARELLKMAKQPTTARGKP